MKDENKVNTQIGAELEDVREFIELYKNLLPSERQLVKGIVIGTQLAKEPELTTA